MRHQPVYCLQLFGQLSWQNRWPIDHNMLPGQLCEAFAFVLETRHTAEQSVRCILCQMF